MPEPVVERRATIFIGELDMYGAIHLRVRCLVHPAALISSGLDSPGSQTFLAGGPDAPPRAIHTWPPSDLGKGKGKSKGSVKADKPSSDWTSVLIFLLLCCCRSRNFQGLNKSSSVQCRLDPDVDEIAAPRFYCQQHGKGTVGSTICKYLLYAPSACWTSSHVELQTHEVFPLGSQILTEFVDGFLSTLYLLMHKELLSSWHNQRGLKPPNRTRHSGGVFCLLFVVDWALLPLSTGRLVLVLLAGNCLPYHQPEFLATKDSKKAGWLSRVLFATPCPYRTGLRERLYLLFPPSTCIGQWAA